MSCIAVQGERMETMTRMETTIHGPYDMAGQSTHFGGWVRGDDDGIVMAFPVEGWTHSAAVVLRQRGDTVEGEVRGGGQAAWEQALAALSLDEDGDGYPAVGDRDPVLGALQREWGYLRPVLFHSPYEAACAFVIGHRIRVTQQRAIRQRIAREHGEAFEIAGTTVHAFPTPQRLRELTAIPGVADEKVARLHAIADAAIDGRLDRARLRAQPADEAIAAMRTLPGIGPFYATGIVLRGAGRTDAVPVEAITRAGIRRLYGLATEPDDAEVERITAPWAPYRMWCSVLVHAWERGQRE
jgi:DNA-3-methyladenine glycosylase II